MPPQDINIHFSQVATISLIALHLNWNPWLILLNWASLTTRREVLRHQDSHGRRILPCKDTLKFCWVIRTKDKEI